MAWENKVNVSVRRLWILSWEKKLALQRCPPFGLSLNVTVLQLPQMFCVSVLGPYIPQGIDFSDVLTKQQPDFSLTAC